MRAGIFCVCLFYSLLYSQCLEKCLGYPRHSATICWIISFNPYFNTVFQYPIYRQGERGTEKVRLYIRPRSSASGVSIYLLGSPIGTSHQKCQSLIHLLLPRQLQQVLPLGFLISVNGSSISPFLSNCLSQRPRVILSYCCSLTPHTQPIMTSCLFHLKYMYFSLSPQKLPYCRSWFLTLGLLQYLPTLSLCLHSCHLHLFSTLPLE